MKCSRPEFFLLLCFFLASPALLAQSGQLRVPKKIQAGSSFSILTDGSGKAVLYIVGPSQVLRRDVNLGDSIAFASGDLHNTGHYVAILSGANSGEEQAQFDVVAQPQPAELSFLAKPSRLPVSQRDGVSGVVYVFDTFRNLITDPQPVAFEISGAVGPHEQVATTRNGVAWVRMNSPSKAGATEFRAKAGNIAEKRVIQQFAGDPCKLQMSAQPSGSNVVLQTEPVRDCNGNPVPDGTIVTFTESYDGRQSTVDVPIKRDIARTEMPVRSDAVISLASGVVLGNEIHLGRGN